MSLKPIQMVRPLSKPLTNTHIINNKKEEQNTEDNKVELPDMIQLTVDSFIDTYTSTDIYPFPQFRFFSLKKSYESILALIPTDNQKLQIQLEKSYKQAQSLSISSNLINFFANSDAIIQKLSNFEWQKEDFTRYADKYSLSAAIISFLQQNWDDAVEADLFLYFYDKNQETVFIEKAEFNLLGFQDEDDQIEILATFGVYCFVFINNNLKYDTQDKLLIHRWINEQDEETLVGL